MASRDPFVSTRVEQVMVVGHEALEGGRFEEAVNQFKFALRLGPESIEEEALVRCKLSAAYEKLSQNREQLETLAKYESFADFARLSERTQLTVLVRLGWAHSFNNDIPRAIALFNQAMRIARSLEDAAGIGACYFGLGRAYRFVSEIRIARDHYRSALDYFRQVGSWRELADCYSCIGTIDAREGDYKGAIHSIKQALTIIGDRQEHDLLGRAYSDIALFYENLELPPDKAIDYWEKGIENFRKSGNSYMLAINYNNLAVQLTNRGEWDRAEELCKTAIEWLRATTRYANLGSALDTLAQLYVLSGRLDEADHLLEESLETFSTIRNKHPLNRGHLLESSTMNTIGRCFLAKGLPEEALARIEKAKDIAVRLGDRYFLAEANLRLAEALLQLNRTEEAREVVSELRASQREAPDMLVWGHMTRLEAKLSIVDNHLASGLQLLGQSTSIFQIKGNVYDLATNRVVLAQILQKQGEISKAVTEAEAGLAVFDQLGAKIDSRKTRDYLARLRQIHETEPGSPLARAATTNGRQTGAAVIRGNVLPASGMDGFIAQRLVQAAVSRDLLLHELASIAHDQAASRAAVVAEIVQNDDLNPAKISDLKPSAVINLTPRQQEDELEFLKNLPAEQYRKQFVYSFSDNQGATFLLHIVDPKNDRFKIGTINLDPIIALVEQGLEAQLLKSRTRRTGVFTPSRLLAEVELPGFVCASRAMSRVLEQIHKIRSSDVTVLITGESGTGKELIARAVHAGSSRKTSTFLPFNCSAAPRDMIESQLFGYRKGAFTGAVETNPGIIRAAERGTLFLDEIGDLPLELQPKLLRFLQEGEIHPIGEGKPLHVDVRVVAATNSDLERVVSEGKFREDLFHRLNVIRIQVPPLRERREEIPALVNHYLNQYQQESAKSDVQISEEALDLMVVYEWPGNVRQLCNELRRIVAYSESGTIATPDMLSQEIARATHRIPAVAVPSKTSQIHAPVPVGETLAEAVEDLERRMIQDALRRSDGNIARAAKELGLSRKGLYLKMDRLNFRA